MVGGGVLANFREGWALEISGDGCAHYFSRDGFDTAKSKCGITASVRWLFDRGDYPLCLKCQRARMRVGIS